MTKEGLTMMDDRPFYEKSPGECSDDELRIAAYVLSGRRDELSGSDPQVAAKYADMAAVAAAERDSRRALRMAVDDATSPVRVVGAVD